MKFDETFTHHGHKFGVKYEHDDDSGPPWEEFDCHGIVSDWTSRAKAPGERVLVKDYSRARYYDVRASMQKALEEGWSASTVLPTDTHRQKAQKAVQADFEYLHGWATDQWTYRHVVVCWIDLDGKPTAHRASLGGVEDQDPAYLRTVALELAENLIHDLPTWLDQQVQHAEHRRTAVQARA